MEDSTVFLGMTLDCKLQWGTHIDTLAGELSSAAYAVRKIRQITDVETARLVYFADFHSVMSYGILLWGKAADIETIFILQKRAVRSINLNLNHVNPSVKNLKK
ncbi:jg21896 [Pararge aegeria aegeria]|uniref:Jg21896 protein n=1 Tax=Pararge aegeria aegeria TaxID=348720 RepID=A0A8S4RPY7_9NEOP|nr:jg21896 [Pararge aegeria aegeria]